MRILKVSYSGIKAVAVGTSASGQVGTFRAEFSFSPDWDAYPERTAVFVASGAPVAVLLDANGKCEVPPEITQHEGRILVGAVGTGTDASGRILRYPGEYAATNISEGVTLDAAQPSPEQVTAYEQMLSRLSEAVDGAEAAAKNAGTAAKAADEVTQRANTASESATTAASDARRAAADVSEKTQAATNAATLANEAAGKANTAADKANEAAGTADASAAAADEAAQRADTAAAEAEAAKEDSVQYNAPQMLTPDEMARARGNIDAAGGITETATGEIITVNDSARAPMRGLRIYGKSTQDGTPSPDAPVPIVSAGNDGSIGIIVRGKNLIDVSQWYSTTSDGITFTTGEGVITAVGTNPLNIAINHPTEITPTQTDSSGYVMRWILEGACISKEQDLIC